MDTQERDKDPQEDTEPPTTHQFWKDFFQKPLEEQLAILPDAAVIAQAAEGPADQMLRVAQLKAKRKQIAKQRRIEDAALERIERQLIDLGEQATDIDEGFRVEAQTMLELDATAPLPPILDRVADAGATLIFGRGGTGKGSYVAWLLLQILRKSPWKRIVLLDFERRPYEWKPRFLALEATDEELACIVNVKAKTSVPVWDQIDEIRAAIADKIGPEPPDLVVVDSAARACAKDISTGDTSLPVKYYGAMDELCIRHLTIAHVNRDNKTQQASGSQRWHDDARLTWSLETKGENRVLICKKHNGGPKPSAVMIRPSGWTPPVEGQLSLITGFTETSYKETLKTLILDVLTGPMTYEEIADALNALNEDEDGSEDYKINSIKNAIQRDTGLFRRSEDDPGSARHPKYEKVPPRPTKEEQAEPRRTRNGR